MGINLISESLERMAQRLETAGQTNFITPADWQEKFFYVPEPRDPVTGEILPPGPIRLTADQRLLVNEALSRDENGLFQYTTVIWSTIKKSGKSTLSSGVAFHLADIIPFAKIFCLANDGKQSTDRLYQPIYTCIQLHQKYNGKFKGIRPNLTEVTLPNQSKIEAVPCDAAGEAGAEPTGVFFSELWGFRTDNQLRLFSEMTIPPTRFGRAIRWVETYAGYQGVSKLLWGLYEQAVLEGEPHPDFTHLESGGEAVVWINKAAGIFCYWDHEPRMPWQKGSEGERYYQQEAKLLVPAEFERIHRNRWISPTGAYLPSGEFWDACADHQLKPLADPQTPVVVGIDAATENDCAALVAVTRDPQRPETDVAIRDCRIFRPGAGRSTIVLEQTVGRVLQEWGQKWNIVCVPYDAYQMEKLVQDYRRGQVTINPDTLKGMSEDAIREHLRKLQIAVKRWYYKFGQGNPRAIADKLLYDMIIHRQVHWNPDDGIGDIAPRGNLDTLTKHVKQAGASIGKSQYRIEKLSNDLKVDGLVALSMAVERCMTLNLDNREQDSTSAYQRYRRGEIGYEQYLSSLAQTRKSEHGT